jgi:hypothetical protein
VRWRATIKDALVIAVGLLAVACITGGAVWGTVAVVHDDVLVHELRTHGTSTPGVVTSITETYSGRFRMRSYHRDITYLDGLTTQDSIRCRCSTVGNPVTVVYDPKDPERAMTSNRLGGWTRLIYLPVVLLLVVAAVLVSGWVATAAKIAAWRYRVLRYGDPRARAQERSRTAKDYIAFVNTHQRRPELTAVEPAEAALASWWSTIQTDAPDSREARLVTDVLAITRL